MSTLTLANLKSLLSGVGINFDNPPTVNGESIQVNENFILNGAMQVDQELGFVDQATPPNSYFFADQWNTSYSAGSNAVLALEYNVLNGSRSARFTAATAATDLTGSNQAGRIFQKLEAQNVFNLNGESVTISAKVKTNWSGELAVAILNHDETRSYNTTFTVVSGDNDLAVTIPLEPDTILNNDASTGFAILIATCNEGTRQTSTLNAWEAGSFLTSTTATQWVKTLDSYVEITQVKLEEGPQATRFVHQKIDDVLAECQRYFRRIRADGGNTLNIATAYLRGTNRAIAGLILPIEMRVAPDITVSNASDITIVYGISGSVSATNNDSVSVNGQNCLLDFDVSGTPFGSGDAAVIGIANGGHLSFDARL